MSETGRDLDRKAVLKEALARIEDLQEKLAAAERSKAEPIAVIGLGCRFPGGADGPDAYWRILQSGIDAVCEVPRDRWDIERYFDPDPRAPGKTYSRWGGYLERVDTFDAEFFGIPPREAITLDPQQRLFLEVVWEALEHAGQAPASLRGSQTGVFVGLTTTEYLQYLNKVVPIDALDAYHASGNTPNAASGRVAFLLGLHGPTVSLDTACSSSLVATHLACQSLRNGDCDMAIAGGVNVILAPETYVCFSKWGMMSPVGRCKTFDASADGFVRAEGCGAVVLKRLTDAIDNGDAILAVVRGSAVNQDGPSSGLSVPNGLAQQQVIRRALANAGVAPEQVGYVETHGTGTTLGDPIEVEALGEVFGPGRPRGNKLALGSVKTNLGHMESAAGVAGLIKVVLTLQHGEIPPHIHLTELTPRIPWDRLPFVVPTESTPWPATGTPRLAGVSAFGFSGTNAHVVLEEAPPSHGAVPEPDRTHHLLVFSAKTERALRDLAGRYVGHTENEGMPWADVCYTAAVGRSHFAHRAAVVAASRAEACTALVDLAVGAPSGKRPKVAFLFTGQGAQYAGMGRRLYDTAPVFREALDRCDQLLGPRLDRRLLSVLFPGNAAAPLLDDTRYTQPALFALEYALAALWRSWGIAPSAVMGHSVGEYVAACVAGVFRLEDALELIATRGRLMAELPKNGAMASVFADEGRVAEAIAGWEDRVSIAAVNGPSSVVVSGRAEAIAELIERLGAEGVRTRRLNVSHAFHSPLMDPVLEPFEEVASRVAYEAPRIGLVSNVTGGISNAALVGRAGYWRQHLRQTVRFEASVRTLYEQGYRIFLEIGPGATLLGMARQCIEDPDAVWLHSLREKREDWGEILQSLGALYVAGAEVDWEAFDRPYARRKVSAPTYPFQRRRFWVDRKAGAGRSAEPASTPASSVVRLIQQGDAETLARELVASGAVSPDDLPVVPRILGALIGRHRETLAAEDARDRMYEVLWREKPRPAPRPVRDAHARGTWLVLADEEGVGPALRLLLEDRGEACVVVRPGAGPAVETGGGWRIDPTRPDDYRTLIEGAAKRAGAPLAGAVHLWSLDTLRSEPMTIESLEVAQRLGCQSVLFLAQAMAAARGSGACRLWAVTRGAVPAGQAPAEASLAQAPVWGLGGALALESPDVWGGMVDLGAEARADDAERLLDELWEPDGDDHVALRLAGRFVPRLRRVASSDLPVPIVANGAYLVTGGLGGLGLEVARWLARRGARHLLLLGRRGAASTEAKAVIAALEEEGVSVRVAAADVGDPEAMSRVIAESRASMPPLRGIVHAAGVAGYHPAEDIDAAGLAAVLRPKLAGTWNLYRLTRETTLDFFVGFSSIASVWGSKGQAHYAAANAFLDAFAHSLRGRGLPAVSVNWGPWTSGMSTPEFQSQMARLGVRALTTGEATGALGAAIDSGRPQVAVANVDWRTFKTVYEVRGRRPLVDEIGPREEEEETPAASAEPPRLRRELEEVPPARRDKLLIARVQEEVAAVMGFEASDLPDPQRGFFDTGMDSLMAVELRDRLQRALGVTLPATLAFDYPNIQVLVGHLLGDVLSLVSPGAVAAATPHGAAAERNELVDRIKGLSDDSIEKLIGDELDALDGR